MRATVSSYLSVRVTKRLSACLSDYSDTVDTADCSSSKQSRLEDIHLPSVKRMLSFSSAAHVE